MNRNCRTTNFDSLILRSHTHSAKAVLPAPRNRAGEGTVRILRRKQRGEVRGILVLPLKGSRSRKQKKKKRRSQPQHQQGKARRGMPRLQPLPWVPLQSRAAKCWPCCRNSLLQPSGDQQWGHQRLTVASAKLQHPSVRSRIHLQIRRSLKMAKTHWASCYRSCRVNWIALLHWGTFARQSVDSPVRIWLPRYHFSLCYPSLYESEATFVEMICLMAKKLLDVTWPIKVKFRQSVSNNPITSL